MKQYLRSLTFIPIFICLVNNLAGANIQTQENGKLDSLNGLKNVHSHLMKNGHIVRLEFKKPVSDWLEPVFYEKSVQIDFPGAFVSPSKKNFIAKSSLISKVYATQFNNKTLRVRFHIAPGTTDIEKRFKLVSQGRFMIIRFDSTGSSPSFSSSQNKQAAKKKNIYIEIMVTDELAQFLNRASQKIKSQKVKFQSKSETIPYSNKIKEKNFSKSIPEVTVKRAGMGVVPFVDQIKKAALSNPKADNKESKIKKEEVQVTTKENTGYSLINSKPTGKPMEFVPSGMKMIAMFALVLGLIFMIFFGFKKYVLQNTAFGGGNKLVSVLGTWFLGPKKNIALVEIAGEVLVLGVSQENITLLSSITNAEMIEEIKTAGIKGRNGMGWNSSRVEDDGNRTTSDKEKARGQFSNYLSKFSKPQETKSKLVSDTKEHILQKIGKMKTARA